MIATIEYRDYDIFPNPRPIRSDVEGEVEFQPIARVMRHGGINSIRVEVDPGEDMHFGTAEAASEYIVERIKAMIDHAEVTL
jgi:hypothetical protein